MDPREPSTEPHKPTLILDTTTYNGHPSPWPSSLTLSSPSQYTSTVTPTSPSYSDSFDPPFGSVIPLPGPRRARSGSFGGRRGYSLSISFSAPRLPGDVALPKGHLEPRLGSLPRRKKKKVVMKDPTINEDGSRAGE
ncbi:hypothetical protein PM082_006790 [Marasmius tenuissimus]|nr:hypothetical protein PM082_006790 [Marasmius tenuissimus]